MFRTDLAVVSYQQSRYKLILHKKIFKSSVLAEKFYCTGRRAASIGQPRTAIPSRSTPSRGTRRSTSRLTRMCHQMLIQPTHWVITARPHHLDLSCCHTIRFPWHGHLIAANLIRLHPRLFVVVRTTRYKNNIILLRCV